MLNYQILLATIGLISWVFIVDRNVGDYVMLSLKLLKTNYEKLKWMAIYHPRNPITNWVMARKYSKIAEELVKELQNEKVES